MIDWAYQKKLYCLLLATLSINARAESLPMPGNILIAEDISWEQVNPLLRRKVYYNNHQTVVLFETKRSKEKSKSISTHTHAQEQMTYILEGKGLAKVGETIREIGPGSIYIAPANVPHGFEPLSEKVLAIDYFTPTRDDFRTGDNEIRSFVYEWFSWFDRQASEDIFLKHLATSSLSMEFPDTKVKNHSDFKRWYDGVRKSISTNSHEIGQIEIARLDSADFQLRIPVIWRAKTRDGKNIELRVRQTWKLSKNMDGDFLIKEYKVSLQNP